jgi:hypothetical protein
MKPAMIALAAALAVAGPFASAQSSVGGSPGGISTGGPAASTTTTGSAAGSTTTGMGAGGGRTGGLSNEAGSISAGQNSNLNPSGNSYINPPPGAASRR